METTTTERQVASSQGDRVTERDSRHDSGHDVTLVAGPGRPPAGEGDLESMLTVALDGIVELCEAARGMFVLFSGEGEVLLGKARTREREDLDPAELALGSPLVDEMRQRGVVCWTHDAVAHPVVRGFNSAGGIPPFSLGCLEVGEPRRICGLVYLDRGERGGEFRRGALQMVEWLAQLISVAVTRQLEGRWRWRFLDATRRYSS